jgi:transposase
MAIALGAADRDRLQRLAANRNTAQKHVTRAQVVLLLADRVPLHEIGRRTGASQPTIRRWRERFREVGVDGLLRDKTRPPGTPPLPAATVQRVVEMTLHRRPPAATHWSSRRLAKAVGIGPSSVHGSGRRMA